MGRDIYEECGFAQRTTFKREGKVASYKNNGGYYTQNFGKVKGEEAREQKNSGRMDEKKKWNRVRRGFLPAANLQQLHIVTRIDSYECIIRLKSGRRRSSNQSE